MNPSLGCSESFKLSSTAEDETAAQRNKQHPIGLLAGVVMVTAIMMAALLTSVYIYNHPTSSISLFFIEVSQRSLPRLSKLFRK